MKKIVLAGMCMMLWASSAWAMAKKPPQTFPDSVAAEETLSQRTLDLKEAYELALNRSEELALQKADIDEVWADFLEASGDVIGDMNFQIIHFRQEDADRGGGDDSGSSATLRNSRRTQQFTLTQPLFQGFKSLGAFRGAKHVRSQQIYEKERAEQLLFLDVATAYFNLQRRLKDIEITRDILTMFQERITELEDWEKIGKSRSSEVATARARMKRAEAVLAQERGFLASETRILEFLTGIPLDNVVLAEETEKVPPGSDPGGTLKELVEAAELRPDVQANESFLNAATQNVVIAQSGLWPEISLDANLYEKRDGSQAQSNTDYDILLTIDVPIYKGGETLGALKRALTERKKAKLLFEQNLRMAQTEIKQSHDAWFYSIQESKALADAVKASQENYDLQREDYEKNLVDNLDVLDALETLNDNRLEANRALTESQINYWKLQTATGNCCESI